MIAIVINLWELPPLLDPTHRIKRAATCFLGFMDLAVIAIGIYSIFEIIFSTYNLSDAPSGILVPGARLRSLAFRFLLALV